jgi:cysteinyl-tRNA synthetase
MWSMLGSDADPAMKSATLIKMDEVLGLGLAAVIGKPLEVPPEVMKLVHAREAARKAKDWKESDRLRDEIAAKGFVVEDAAGGGKVRPAR